MADLTITELQEDTTLTGTEEVPIWDSGTTKKATLDAIKTFVGASAGVSDHGALTGLGDDDHPHYFNETRGDARYSQLAHNHSGVYQPLMGADENYVTNAQLNKVDTLGTAAFQPSTAFEPAGAASAAVAAIINSAPATLDTLNELATALGNDANFATTITNALAGKQPTLVSGMNIKTINSQSLLGSGDITISGGGTGTGDMLASVYDPDADGKISYNDLEDKPTLGTAAFQSATAFAPVSHSHAQSDITNLVTDLAGKQATLVAGTNIKTINGQSPLGSGDITISGGSATVQQTTVSLAQNASTNITATAILGVYEKTFIDSATPANAIDGGTYAGFAATSAFDNNTATGWAASQIGAATYNTSYIGQSNLTSPVLQVNMYTWENPAANMSTIKLQYSDNGSTWVDIATVEPPTSPLTWISVNVPAYTPAGDTHSFRLLAYNPSHASSWHFYEIELATSITYTAMLDTDIEITRSSATGECTNTVKRLKTGTAEMVIDYI